jgi:hypothetical protein
LVTEPDDRKNRAFGLFDADAHERLRMVQNNRLNQPAIQDNQTARERRTVEQRVVDLLGYKRGGHVVYDGSNLGLFIDRVADMKSTRPVD